MAFQSPNCVISMGIGHAAGFAEVPEARPMSNVPGSCAAKVPAAHTMTTSLFAPIMTLLTQLPHYRAATVRERFRCGGVSTRAQ